MDRTWSHVGRDGELAAVEAAFDTAEVAGVLLVGEVGVGRTRLVREVEHRLRVGRGCRVEWVSARVVPVSVSFGAMAHLLPDGVRPDDHPVAVITAVARDLAAAGGRQGVALVVDDAHRLDIQSAALVGHLALRQVAFVVATVLRGQRVPDPVAALGRDGLLRWLDVEPLGPAEMDGLIDDELDGPVDGITRHRLRQVANGRPAVLRELLTCGVRSGALRQRYGAWRWHGAVVGARRVAEQIASQLDACSPPVRDALEVVACSEPVSLWVLEGLVERAGIEVAERQDLLRLERRGLRVEVRLPSPLHAEAIRERTPVTRTRRICSGLAERLAATPMRRAPETGHLLVDALRSWLLLFDGSYEPALEVARTVLAAAAAGPQAIVWAAAGGVGAAGLLGRLDEAMAIRRRGVAVADAHSVELPWGRAQVECAACAALYYCGDVRAAQEVAEAGYRAAARIQEPLMLGISALQRGILATAGGRPVTGQALLREAVVLLEDTDTRLVEFCLAELGLAMALAGDMATLQPAAEAEVNRAFDPWRRRAEAWVHAAQGATSRAVTTLLNAATVAGSPTTEAHLLYDAARLGAAAQVSDRLEELARVVEGPFVGALATCARAFAGSPDLGRAATDGLVDAAERLAELGHPVMAAEAVQTAARAYGRLALRSRARICSERGVVLLGECEQVRTPLLLFDATSPLLTAREREIALLATTLTSRDIAAQLGVAVSTVNNHLAQVYVKLGISGRGELARLLGAPRHLPLRATRPG